MLLVLILFLIIVSYQIKFEKFTSTNYLSSSTLKKIADDVKLAIHQKRDQKKFIKKMNNFMGRLN